MSAFADPSETTAGCLGARSSAISVNETTVTLDLQQFEGLVAISISKGLMEELVKRSEKVARGEIEPACEKINGDPSDTACYSASAVDLRLFGGFAAISLCTADLKAALSASK